MYTSRTLSTFFTQAAQQFPIMLLTGARQVGKTTFLRHLSEANRRYLTLDDPLLLLLAREDPALLMQRFPPPLLIDEIQYAPQLLPYLKMAADNAGQPNGYWLTGSQQFQLMQGASESLAGRVGIVQLLGLSQAEINGQSEQSWPFLPSVNRTHAENTDSDLSVSALFSRIWRGSYPAMALSNTTDRHLFFSSYVQTYLQRDVRDLARVGDEMAFLRFLKASAARSGQLLNLAELARDADIAPNTAKNWLSILEASGVVYLLQPYFNNINKRLVKTPKLYFLDTGLCAWLTDWSSPETLASGAASGALLETWVVGELLKSWWHNGLQAPFYFYRDKDQKEIDVLIVQDGQLYPIEIKKTASPTAAAIRHFQVLEGLKQPIGAGALLCLIQQPLPLTATVTALPIGHL